MLTPTNVQSIIGEICGGLYMSLIITLSNIEESISLHVKDIVNFSINADHSSVTYREHDTVRTFHFDTHEYDDAVSAWAENIVRYYELTNLRVGVVKSPF